MPSRASVALALAVAVTGVMPSGATFGAGDTAPPTASGMAAFGVMMGAMSVGMLADAVVSAADDLKPGQRETLPGTGSQITGTLQESALSMDFDGQQDGVAITFKLSLSVHPCPDKDGRFDLAAKLDVHTSKGGAGTNGTIDIKVSGRVDDDARLAGADVTTNTQWADFADGHGGFLDYTMTRTGGAYAYTANRTGGSVTAELRKTAVFMSTFLAYMVENRVVKAAEKSWSSGRCVELKVTPSDGPENLEPGSVVSVLAEPRSKLDGTPTGGKVTATLTGGGASVGPNGTPVQADASSTYTAPGEPDKSGTVAYESRSKRGVGKAGLTFKTSAPAAYRITGGLQDWKVNQVVCDITKPFTLKGKIGSMKMSGGLSGTYVFDGMFSAHYEGTYQVTLPHGPGMAGTMIGTGAGTIAGHAGSGSEKYTLTPVTC